MLKWSNISVFLFAGLASTWLSNFKTNYRYYTTKLLKYKLDINLIVIKRLRLQG